MTVRKKDTSRGTPAMAGETGPERVDGELVTGTAL